MRLFSLSFTLPLSLFFKQVLAKTFSLLPEVQTVAHAFRGELGTNDPAEENTVELIKSVL